MSNANYSETLLHIFFIAIIIATQCVIASF